MTMLDRKYPQYGFAKHKGYSTQQHMAALRSHGACRIHRQSFAQVAERMRQQVFEFEE
jgi:ribonuclease HII